MTVGGVSATGAGAGIKRTTGHHHGDLRNALERAALELVAARGPRGFSLAEVTRRAGVSVGAPYKHFADRDALLAALAQRGYEEQRARFANAVAGEQDPVEQLAAFAASYVEFAAEERPLFEITFRSGLDKSLYPSLAAAGTEVLNVIVAPARSVRSTDDEAMDLVFEIAASAHGFAMFLLEGVFDEPGTSLERVIERAKNAARTLTNGVDPHRRG